MKRVTNIFVGLSLFVGGIIAGCALFIGIIMAIASRFQLND